MKLDNEKDIKLILIDGTTKNWNTLLKPQIQKGSKVHIHIDLESISEAIGVT